MNVISPVIGMLNSQDHLLQYLQASRKLEDGGEWVALNTLRLFERYGSTICYTKKALMDVHFAPLDYIVSKEGWSCCLLSPYEVEELDPHRGGWPQNMWQSFPGSTPDEMDYSPKYMVVRN